MRLLLQGLGPAVAGAGIGAITEDDALKGALLGGTIGAGAGLGSLGLGRLGRRIGRGISYRKGLELDRLGTSLPGADANWYVHHGANMGGIAGTGLGVSVGARAGYELAKLLGLTEDEEE